MTTTSSIRGSFITADGGGLVEIDVEGGGDGGGEDPAIVPAVDGGGDDKDGDDVDKQNNGEATVATATNKRTPIPGNVDHVVLLFRRLLALDLFRTAGNRRFFFFRTFSAVLFWMLYTIGWFSNPFGANDTGIVVTESGVQYFVFPPVDLAYPSGGIIIGGDDANFTDAIGSYVVANFNVTTTVVTDDNGTVAATFRSLCESQATNSTEVTCAYVFGGNGTGNDPAFDVFFGGGASAPANGGAAVVATQQAVGEAVVAAAGYDVAYPTSQIQQTPIPYEDFLDSQPVNVPTVTAIGALMVLAVLIMHLFALTPVVQENLREVKHAFVRAGVDELTYYANWILYLSFWSLFTAAAFTGVSIGWKLYRLSNGFLIFMSHFMALAHSNVLLVIIGNISKSEEYAQGLPLLGALASLAVAVPLVAVDLSRYTTALSVLSVLSPYVGIAEYNAIYVSYDFAGKGVGVQLGNGSVRQSGLLGSMLGQFGGIVFSSYVLYRWVQRKKKYSNRIPTGAKKCSFLKYVPIVRHFVRFTPDGDEALRATTAQTERTMVDPANFEPLPHDADVLLQVTGLEQTFPADDGRGNDKKVLRGLDMEVCRGEVLGFLGHNGAGKTTTIRILSSELGIQTGQVVYNFDSGTVDLSEENLRTVKSRMGICPQHNNLLGDDTCRETLRFFARLKGNVPLSDGQSVADGIEDEVERRLHQIQLTSPEDADKPVKTFSGGMKRKVSIAIAFLGDPEVVFLDEPTAGMDPYNRRVIWDMILGSKEGRSIVLTTHFLDEADVLSDRVAIIKKGRLETCGRSLFLKHQFGAGYSLKFASPKPVDVSSLVLTAESVSNGNESGTYEWNLKSGSEPSFPSVLHLLQEEGASNVSVELTTLEQVFLATGQEDEEDELGENGETEEDPDSDKYKHLNDIWEQKSERVPLSYMGKLIAVQWFMLMNSMKMKWEFFENILRPLIYLIGGFIVTFVLGPPASPTLLTPSAIQMNTSVGNVETSLFFGVPNVSGNPLSPIVATSEPTSLADFFSGGPPYTGGYAADNSTLLYNKSLNDFSSSIGLQILANTSAIEGGASVGIASSIQQLPYTTEQGFNVGLIVLPICIAYGFAGLAFATIDVLLLKGDNVITLFRVAGINEFLANLGVATFKFVSAFLPFFVLAIILGLAFASVLFGNGGRWLATLLIMLTYAYSATPLGLLFAQVFRSHDADTVRKWFPAVYMMGLSLPYLAWSMVLSFVPSAFRALQIVGDILTLFPPFALQLALGRVVLVSDVWRDPNLSWATVYSWENRIWYSFLIMFVVGTLEWMLMYYIAKRRPATTKLEKYHNAEALHPVDAAGNQDVAEEQQRAFAGDSGIKCREVVKVFKVPPSQDARRSGSTEKVLKQAVKGVSFGVENDEIYVLLGPNGSGKTTTMEVLASEYTPEHGEIALGGQNASNTARTTDHLFSGCDVSYCPQFDALFKQQTVMQHLKFYARIRGLDWRDDKTVDHVNAIVHLLGLKKYLDTQSGNLSGGYKRRLSLAVAMIGYPKAMMVDECTTGMDPGARHLVWDALKPEIAPEVRSYQLPSILFSTHYMDEAAKLGSRIGIMVDGQLVATGSLDTLRNRYCNRYYVEVALDPAAPASTESAICEIFRSRDMDAEVFETLPHRFKMQIPFQENSKIDVSQLAIIFSLLEENRDRCHIEFYSVAEMSLEQIFMDLSKKQFDLNESFRGLY